MGRNIHLALALALCLALTGCQEQMAGYSYAPDQTTDTVVDDTAVDVQEEPEIETQVEDTNPETEIPVTSNHDPVELEIEGDVIEINERVFITQINDIYYNFADYADKTIVVEGMYAIFYSWDMELSCPGVYRNGPGCCGNDGWGGFMLNYDGEYPQQNDWIRVTGTPELVLADDGYLDLFLNVISLEVMEERGAEYVLQ